MGKSVVNPVYATSANAAYAKGGHAPRRKGQRKVSYDLFPTFADQQGHAESYTELRPNNIVSVQPLGTFLGYGCHSNEVTYRAFSVLLNCGTYVAAYSKDGDDYVICLHTGYQAHKGRKA